MPEMTLSTLRSISIGDGDDGHASKGEGACLRTSRLGHVTRARCRGGAVSTLLLDFWLRARSRSGQARGGSCRSPYDEEEALSHGVRRSSHAAGCGRARRQGARASAAPLPEEVGRILHERAVPDTRSRRHRRDEVEGVPEGQGDLARVRQLTRARRHVPRGAVCATHAAQRRQQDAADVD